MLVSGDGDYKPVVEYLIEKGRFLRILAPNMQYCSSLYKKWSNFPRKYISTLSDLRSLLKHNRDTHTSPKQKRGPRGTDTFEDTPSTLDT
jgi:hypothetical protein